MKSIGRTSLLFTIIAAIIVGISLLFTLGVKAAEFIAPFLLAVAGFLLVVNVMAVIAALSPKLRFISGTTLLVSSYIYGITVWIYGLVVTLSLWGVLALIIGLILGGVGVVPIGMLAALFNTEWSALLTLVALGALTIGTRITGLALTTPRSRQGSSSSKKRDGVIDLEAESVEYKTDGN